MVADDCIKLVPPQRSCSCIDRDILRSPLTSCIHVRAAHPASADMAGQPRRLVAARFCRGTPSEGGRGVKAASQSTAACRMSMSMMSRQRHWPLPNPARGSLSSSRRLFMSGGTGTACPERRSPSATTLDSQQSFCHGHRSPARPHDASRSPLGSGGTERSIEQVSGAGIDWGSVPVVDSKERRGERFSRVGEGQG